MHKHMLPKKHTHSHSPSLVFVLSSCRLGDDNTTCFMGQQMGLFDVDDPSKCDKPKYPGENSTAVDFLVSGALMCCKSKEVDQTVCKSDKCVFGMMKCMATHGDKLEIIEKKLTNPKAMQTDDDGEMSGSCPTAIKNRVEGALCCTAEMNNTVACVRREVGDYKVCEDSWNKAFDDLDFFDTAKAVMESFTTGGYCAGIKPNGAQTPSGCSKCGTFKISSRLSCCAPGGAWFKNCGGLSSKGVDHKWSDGVSACKCKFKAKSM